MQLHRWALGSSVFALVFIVAACGGGKKNDQAATPPTAATSAAARVATSEATRAPATTNPTTTPATPTTTARGNEPVIAADCLKSVKSYRYTGKMQLGSGLTGGAALAPNDITLSGAVVAPDRTQLKLEANGQAFETITIGSDTWLRVAGGAWNKTTGTSPFSFSLDDFCRANLASIDTAGVQPTRETLAGQSVLRYEFDRKALAKLNTSLGQAGSSADLPANAKMTVWVTEKERWPVRLILTGGQSGGNDPNFIALEFTLSDLNASSVRIDAP